MKASILCPNLSSNALGRAYILAQILQKKYKVEIIGPITEKGLWSAISYENNIKIKSGRTRKLLGKIDGDIIFASKPLIASFGLGIIKKLINKKILFLDIDDWELGFIKNEYKSLSFLKKIKRLSYDLIRIHWISSFWNNWICEKLVFFADEIIVSNTFLQKKFKGEIIWHGRDKDLFNPKNYNPVKIREKLKIGSNDKIIIFSGTPRAHKGLEDLIDAVYLIKDKNVKLLLLGLDNGDYSKRIKKMAQEKIKERFIGKIMQPMYKVPEYLSIADIVVIPQRKNHASVGQIPAKIFDAMAMEKPIIATKVNDIPEIIKNCGWLVESENPEEIAFRINYILNNEKEAKDMGKKAREKFISEYSLQVMTDKLLKIVESKLEQK